ncbi:MAG: riboflavin synthase [Deltaproteobacteria bacterium]|nr:MAG: riboflavin synthase [Deltaproteobacteria bacterium]
MFTGIIEGIGQARGIRLVGQEATFIIKVPAFFSDCHPGDSLAVDGVCLSITSVKGDLFTLDISVETLKTSTLGNIKQGGMVNLERALRLSDRLGGHLVSGHVDGTGIIERIERLQRSWILQIGIDQPLSRYLIEKGSIAVDGISLTISRCMGSSFDVTIIPQTAGVTTIVSKRVGDRVNIEIDLISKYIERFLFHDGLATSKERPSSVDRDMLIRHGFGGGNGHI